MILRPCTRCRWRGQCDLQRDMRDHLKGGPSRVTSVLFDCDYRLRDLEPGRRVVVRFQEEVGQTPGGYDEPPLLIMEERDFTGTSMGWTRNWERPKAVAKVRVWLDEPTARGNTRIALHPDAFVSTGKRVPVCPDCSRPLSEPRTPGFYCPACALLEGGAPRDQVPRLMLKWRHDSEESEAEQAVRILEADPTERPDA